MKPLTIYIGTEPRMWLATEVLKYSILKHASQPVEIVEMDYSKGGIWGDWDMGRESGIPATRSLNDQGNAVWFTDFTNFRWAIPEANGFEGTAIYMDADEIVLGDVYDLLSYDQTTPILSLRPDETSVMVMDCQAFNTYWWPSIADMKTNGFGIKEYIKLLRGHKAFDFLPTAWNCLDGQFYGPHTKLVHYTAMNSQPNRPYPERLTYRRHPIPEMEFIWFDVFYEMIEQNLIDLDQLAKETGFNTFEQIIAMEYDKR